MKNATIRWVLILALLSSVGIIATQVFWVRSAYQLEEKEFKLNVNIALRNVATKIWEVNQIQPLVYNVVDRVSPDYFIVQTNVDVNEEILGHLLKEEFEKRLLITDFEYGMYDCMKEMVASTHYVHMSGSNEKFAPINKFPQMKRVNYYFGVHFPHRSSFMVKQLSIWIVSSFGLFCVLLFLGYVVFIILKQKRLSEVQKDFVNNMTHEFKTPLSSIQLAAEVLKSPNIIEKPQRLLSYATIIDNEAVQLTKQIERVLQMAHAEKGQLIIHKDQFVWQDLIKEVSTSFEGRLKQKDGKIILTLPDNRIDFAGDELHLRNVFSNLLDNALKYSKGNPVIEIQLVEKRGTIEISIADNGIGVEKEHLKFLFKKFYRVPTGNVHDVKGFGLGLNYVQIIIKAHGGKVFCKSELGVGSTFYLIFQKTKI